MYHRYEMGEGSGGKVSAPNNSQEFFACFCTLADFEFAAKKTAEFSE